MSDVLLRHATVANAYIYCDDAGALWWVPAKPGGWADRRPYVGYVKSLRPMSAAFQRVCAGTYGVPLAPRCRASRPS